MKSLGLQECRNLSKKSHNAKLTDIRKVCYEAIYYSTWGN